MFSFCMFRYNYKRNETFCQSDNKDIDYNGCMKCISIFNMVDTIEHVSERRGK